MKMRENQMDGARQESGIKEQFFLEAWVNVFCGVPRGGGPSEIKDIPGEPGRLG